VGYDAATGKLLWRVPKMLGRIVSPVRWTHKGRDYIIALDQEAVCLEPRSGKVLWKTPAPHGGGNTPAVDEDLLITTGNDTSGVTAFRITPESCAKLWEVDRKYPLNGYACPILWSGHLYFLSKNKGGAAIFVCVELAGGKVIATTPADGVGGCGSPVAGDGRLFTESGAEGVVVADLDPKNFRVTGKGEANVNFSCSTTPAYADGKLVVRCNVGVKCFDMRKTARRP
jgi:outer membrane protein assembly factor BamB